MNNRWISQNHQRSHQQRLIEAFFNSREFNLLLLNEPVGFGKSRALLEFAIKNKIKCHFLTYSNSRARETEVEYIELNEEYNTEVSFIRLFGANEIGNECHGTDISECIYLKKRQANIDKKVNAFDVCKGCEVNNRCPYYRTRVMATESYPLLTIGTTANLETESYFDFKDSSVFKKPELIILDEDAWKKFGTRKKVSVRDIKFCLGYLQYKRGMENQLVINGDAESEPLSTDAVLEKIKQHDFRKKIKDYDYWLRFIELTNSSINVAYSETKDIYELRFIPDVKKYKIIVADATSIPKEISGAFNLPESEIVSSYNWVKDGFIEPKQSAEVHQVVEYVSQDLLFGKDKRESEKLKELNEVNVRELLKYVKEQLNRTKMDFSNTYIITKMELTKNKRFCEIVIEEGLNIDENIYIGNCRGRNALKKKSIVIFGASLPDDDDTKQMQLLAGFKYDENDFVNSYAVIKNGRPTLVSTEDITYSKDSEKQNAASDWIAIMENINKGAGGRKVAEESVIQAIRARTFHFEVKVLVFSIYPLTRYGIVANTLIGGRLRERIRPQKHTERDSDVFIKKLIEVARIDQFSIGYRLEYVEEIRGTPFKNYETAKKSISKLLTKFGYKAQFKRGKILWIRPTK